MYLDNIWVTLFFYIIASLIEAFCVAFYKSRNACGVKLGQIFSSQVAFEHRKCPKVTGARSGENGGCEKIVIQRASPPVCRHLVVKCGQLKTLFSISTPSNYQVTGLLHMYCKRDEHYLLLIPISHIKTAPSCTTLQWCTLLSDAPSPQYARSCCTEARILKFVLYIQKLKYFYSP